MSIIELLSSPEIAEEIIKLLMYLLVAILLAGVAFYYFYSTSETSQVIKVLTKYQHTEFQELEILEGNAAGRRFFMLKGSDNQKRVTINRFGKISEINE